MRKTKIVATVGPSCDTTEMIRELILSGVNVFRLNMSHGEHGKVGELIQVIRKNSEDLERPVSILMDIQGPKIRVGVFKDSQIELVKGQRFTFDQEAAEGTNERVSTTYKTIHQDVRPGDQILLDDGKMEVKVVAVEMDRVETEVITGGILKNKKGMNLPDVTISLPPLTEKDIKDIHFGCTQDIDYIAMSFVQRAQDVTYLRNILNMQKRSDVGIISKIEKIGAVEDIDKIIDLSDAIMVARGDLGVELGPEKVPNLQKRIITKCNKVGVPVITATQMLDSMEKQVRPTRAEASDVANAILDGTDAVMLSGETAAGMYPRESVEMMRKIILETESDMQYGPRPFPWFEIKDCSIPQALSYSSAQVANAIGAHLICCFTSGGKQPRIVSQFRPRQPIVAVTFDRRVANRVMLYWGVVPIIIKELSRLDDEIVEMEDQLLKKNWASEGEKVIIMGGIPTHISGSTNMLKVHALKDATTLEKNYIFDFANRT